MPNWSYTTVTLSGPDAEIERFKEACTFTEPTEGRNGIDFECVIPMPKVDWPECSSSVDTALVVLGRPELHVCFGGSEKTVDDLIERALKICATRPSRSFPAKPHSALMGTISVSCNSFGSETRIRSRPSTSSDIPTRSRRRTCHQRP